MSREYGSEQCNKIHAYWPATTEECINSIHPAGVVVDLMDSNPLFKIEIYLRLWVDGDPELARLAIQNLEGLFSEHRDQGQLSPLACTSHYVL
jgi:hypothetical protein